MQKKEEKKTNTQEKAVSIDTFEMVDRLVQNAQQALKEYMELGSGAGGQHCSRHDAWPDLDKHMLPGEDGRTKKPDAASMEDKVIKNMFRHRIYLALHQTCRKPWASIDENEMEGYVEVAEPVGVVAGVTPVTNPTSTTMFKSLICAKTRNPIIFGFHPSAQKCSARGGADPAGMRQSEAGAPEHCIQWIEHSVAWMRPTALMNHPGRFA